MKKLIFLIAFMALTALTFGQRVYSNDTILAPTSGDTTINMKMFTGAGWSLEVNVKDFDEDSTIFDLGGCADTSRNVFNRLDDSDLPYNMVADSSHVFSGDNFLSRFLQLRITTDGVTAGKDCIITITKE